MYASLCTTRIDRQRFAEDIRCPGTGVMRGSLYAGAGNQPRSSGKDVNALHGLCVYQSMKFLKAPDIEKQLEA